MESTTSYPVRWTTADLVLFEGDRTNLLESILGSGGQSVVFQIPGF